MPGLAIKKAGITRGNPAFCILGFSRGLRVTKVLAERTWRAVEHLTTVRDPDLDARCGHTDGIAVDLAVGLLGEKNTGLGLTIELLQIDPQRAIEHEQLRTYGLTCCVTNTHLGQARGIEKGRINHGVTHAIAKPVHQGDVAPLQQSGAGELCMLNRPSIKRPLDPRRILHTNLYSREQAFKEARWCKKVGCADLL